MRLVGGRHVGHVCEFAPRSGFVCVLLVILLSLSHIYDQSFVWFIGQNNKCPMPARV